MEFTKPKFPSNSEPFSALEPLQMSNHLPTQLASTPAKWNDSHIVTCLLFHCPLSKCSISMNSLWTIELLLGCSIQALHKHMFVLSIEQKWMLRMWMDCTKRSWLNSRFFGREVEFENRTDLWSCINVVYKFSKFNSHSLQHWKILRRSPISKQSQSTRQLLPSQTDQRRRQTIEQRVKSLEMVTNGPRPLLRSIYKVRLHHPQRVSMSSHLPNGSCRLQWP